MTADRAGSSWRVAGRLARREVRRRPGRTVLVTILVAIPILAMTLGSVLFRTENGDGAADFRRYNGAADIASYASPGEPATLDRLVEALPAGSRTTRFQQAWIPIRLTGEHTRPPLAELSNRPIDDRSGAGPIELTDGRVPRAGELVLSERLARDLDVDLGDRLDGSDAGLAGRVVGIVQATWDFDQPLLIAPGFDFSRIRPEYIQEHALVDLPAGATPHVVARRWTAAGLYADSVDGLDGVAGSEDMGRVLRWGWVVGALGLAVTGIVITAAFATSARRQLMTLGQLSANGAAPRLLRRTLALQGSWSGLLGSMLAVSGTLGALFLWRDPLERLIGHRLAPYVVAPGDLAIIIATGVAAATIAAYLPARAVARTPVLSALAGRRPVAPLPRALLPIGVLAFIGGVALLGLVAGAVRDSTSESGDLLAAAAVFGGLGVLGGVCCSSPALVSTLGPMAARVGGSARLAARSLARLRSRSGAVVAAIATAGAVAVAIATAVTWGQNPGGPQYHLAENQVIVSADLPYLADDEPLSGYSPGDVRPSDETLAAVGRIVPHMTFRSVAVVSANRNVLIVRPADRGLGLSPFDRAALRRTGSLKILSHQYFEDSPLPESLLTIPDGTLLPISTPLARDSVNGWAAESQVLLTPERADALGLETVESAWLVGTADQDLTADQRKRLSRVGERGYLASEYFTNAAAEADKLAAQPYVRAYAPPDPTVVTRAQLAVVGAALVFTLLVVTMGLALSAVESRDERDVLFAVGAPPKTLRRVAGAKALLLGFGGAVLAVPAGFVPMALILRQGTMASQVHHPVPVPWLTIELLVLAIPLVAAAAAWSASRISQWVRPVRMSTISPD